MKLVILGITLNAQRRVDNDLKLVTCADKVIFMIITFLVCCRHIISWGQLGQYLLYWLRKGQNLKYICLLLHTER